MFGSHVDNSSKIIVQIWAGESDIGNKDERWSSFPDEEDI